MYDMPDQPVVSSQTDCRDPESSVIFYGLDPDGTMFLSIWEKACRWDSGLG